MPTQRKPRARILLILLALAALYALPKMVRTGLEAYRVGAGIRDGSGR
jgi:hypothetical protein